MKYGGESLMPRSVKVLIGPSAWYPLAVHCARFVVAFHLQIVHLVINVERRRMADSALALAEEDLLAQ